jgi:hypothetical protein
MLLSLHNPFCFSAYIKVVGLCPLCAQVCLLTLSNARFTLTVNARLNRKTTQSQTHIRSLNALL